MNNEVNDIKNYSAEDFRRYWNNQMSSAEMHTLEKAAMDDPFLADALEGYSKLKEDPSDDIAVLRNRLAARTKGAPVIQMKRNYWWRVAALILLIGGLGTLTFLFTNSNDTAITAVQRNEAKKEATNDSQAFKQSEPAVQADTALKYAAPLDVASKDEERYKLDFVKPKISTRETNQQGAVASESDTSTTGSYSPYSNEQVEAFKKAEVAAPVARSVVKNKEMTDSTRGRQSQDEDLLAKTAPQGNYINQFSGKVVDAQNRSIPFATIRMANANQIAAADRDGNFQFRSRDSIAEISVSSAGYRDRYVTINSNQQAFNIQLDPLHEKGKLKAAEERKSSGVLVEKEASDLKGYVMDGEPVIGWDKYNLYLDSNKRIPTSEPRIAGDVVVSFKVNQKGELSSFEIAKTLSKAYDKEAIRLIKEGPAWRVIKGKKAKVKVIVKF